MFTIAKNWLESHTWRSDLGVARKERRAARRLSRVIAKDQAVGRLIDEAFLSGEKDRILKAFSTYRLIFTGEIQALESFVFGYKTLLRRALENIERLEQDIKANAHEDHKDVLLGVLRQMEQELLASYTSFFRGITSFQNTSYSATRLLDRASQVRDLYYQAVELRGPVRDLTRWLNDADRNERGNAPRPIVDERKRYETALNALKAELQRLGQGISDALILLQEIRADVMHRRELLEQAVSKEDYPKVWAVMDAKFLDDVVPPLDKWLASEISQSRLFLADLERAQG